MKVYQLFEGRGAQVLAFNDYVNRMAEVSPVSAERYKKIGIELFKEGFTYEDTLFHKLPEEGGVYEIYLPIFNNKEAIKRGDIRVNYYNWNNSEKFEYDRLMSVKEIERYAVPVFLDLMKKAARKVK